MTSEFAVPHRLGFGVAYSTLDEDALTVSADFSWRMFSNSHTAGHGGNSSTTDWIDALHLNLGAAYFVAPMIPVRVGGQIGGVVDSR